MRLPWGSWLSVREMMVTSTILLAGGSDTTKTAIFDGHPVTAGVAVGLHVRALPNLKMLDDGRDIVMDLVALRGLKSLRVTRH